ncbi:NAD(P)H-binding protein [Shimia ponticola]|uniref:NAD(P)H-binding protein n=1 Tax=Shimia ponticola TaxID=2582893 RepID=UPI0021075CCE|nr:NAD(P)H-binding protein [Shimia ponticola]
MTPPSRHVLVFGGTGTAGQGAVRGLLRAGHRVTCYVRRADADLPDGVDRRVGSLSEDDLCASAFAGDPFDAVLSCLASRSGSPKDAWAIDHDAHQRILTCAKEMGVETFVLLSAICVQKPQLAFQKAKLAFEDSLASSGLTYSIVRPTAFFKSLSGQVDRLRAGKPFLVFGDGALTACKPISDDDLGDYLARCITDGALQNSVLPIGGPGPAITPLEQGAQLFDALGLTPKYKHVPVAIMDTIIAVLSAGGRLFPKLAEKAEFARTGRYYATESMLVWDPENGRYDAAATPETGSDTLQAFYRNLAETEATVDLGQHAMFQEKSARTSPGARYGTRDSEV